ncbi:MAG: DEAD/DEAH box helicase [archaeon]|nr:DEAD/DEAH box helicase [archaeon]
MTTFKDLGVSPELCKTAEEMGWTEATPVQCEAIPEGLKGKDLIAKAQTGTGKTGAYAMISMCRTEGGFRNPAVLVVSPTRELAMQVDGEMRKLSKRTGHVSVAVYGGADIRKQAEFLRRGCDIVVGTPGRLKDMIDREFLVLDEVSVVVLDEADRMLDMGFEEDLDYILAKVPEDRQTLMFSATMTDDVHRLAEEMLHDPVEVDTSVDSVYTGLTEQYIVVCKREEKRDLLFDLLMRGEPKTIVFCATKLMVDNLYEDMRHDRTVGTLHGDMPQKLRERVIGDFRDNRVLILLATDVAARGIDVTDVDLVINYDIPYDPETYVHRIGRTGRAGKEGMAISFVTKRELGLVREFEDETDTRIRKIVPEDFPEFDVDHPLKEREPVRREKPRKQPKAKPAPKQKVADDGIFVPISINLGKDDGLNRTQIADFVRNRAGLPDNAVGKVGLKNDTAFVEIDSDYCDEALPLLDGAVYNGKPIVAAFAPKKKKYQDKK